MYNFIKIQNIYGLYMVLYFLRNGMKFQKITMKKMILQFKKKKGKKNDTNL